MVLPRLYNRYIKKALGLYWWRYEYPKKLNFGDEITPFIVERLFNRRCKWVPPNKCDVAGAGSIIEILERESKGNPIAVWGSGFIESGEVNEFKNLNFHAVRGKLSQDRIGNFSNIALGDPALLLPLIFKPKRSETYKIGIIPHYVDVGSKHIEKLRGMDGVTIIDVLKSPEEVIELINSCQLILSSSLHGLIVSDAYNIPNYWIPLSNNVYGGKYKFDDYYSIFDRKAQPLDIASIDTKDIKKLVKNYKTIQNQLPKIQKDLIESFPYK
jgi:hypothetical protein